MLLSHFANPDYKSNDSSIDINNLTSNNQGAGKYPRRQSQVQRNTKETQIQLALNLDGTGRHRIQTGLPFFDHMLTQISVHGLFDIDLFARGDLQIDPHHTMEDVGLVLGQGFREALGNRAGIVRMAAGILPDG